MSELIPHDPDPTPENQANSERQQEEAQQAHPGKGRSARPPILSAEECVQNLAQLAGLIAMGLIKPAQANAIRANYEAIIAYHRCNASRGSQASLANEDVLELAARDPEILAMLEPLFTDEQISMLMQRRGKK